MAGDAARKGELLEQALHPVRVLPDVRIALAVAALQPGVGHDRRSAVAGTNDQQDVEIPGPDDSVQMRVEKIESRRGAPMPQQPGLDVLQPQGILQQRIVEQVDLPDRKVVCGAPPGINPLQLLSLRFGGHRKPLR